MFRRLLFKQPGISIFITMHMMCFKVAAQSDELLPLPTLKIGKIQAGERQNSLVRLSCEDKNIRLQYKPHNAEQNDADVQSYVWESNDWRVHESDAVDLSPTLAIKAHFKVADPWIDIYQDNLKIGTIAAPEFVHEVYAQKNSGFTDPITTYRIHVLTPWRFAVVSTLDVTVDLNKEVEMSYRPRLSFFDLSQSLDRSVRTWDVHLDHRGHSCQVLAINHDMSRIVEGCDQKTLVYDTAYPTGEPIWSIKIPNRSYYSASQMARFLDDNSLILFQGEQNQTQKVYSLTHVHFHPWNLATSRTTRTIVSNTFSQRVPDVGTFAKADISSDAKTLVVLDGDTFSLISTEDGQVLKQHALPGLPHHVKFCSNSSYFIFSDIKSQLYVSNMTDLTDKTEISHPIYNRAPKPQSALSPNAAILFQSVLDWSQSQHQTSYASRQNAEKKLEKKFDEIIPTLYYHDIMVLNLKILKRLDDLSSDAQSLYFLSKLVRRLEDRMNSILPLD